jgi:hypothetical protein
LQYLVTGSRFDLANIVRVLSKYLMNYTESHWKMGMRVLKYLVGTKSYGLVYDLTESMTTNKIIIETWSDSDWANDKIDRKSISGFVTMVNGQVICSKDIKQDIVTASTCHAEIVAANTAARDAMWTMELFKECYLTPEVVKLILDNHGAERLCNHPGSHKRSKHIEVRHLMVREYVERGLMETFTVESKENIADGNTKALTESQFIKFRDNLGIVNVKSILTSSDAKLNKTRPLLRRLNWSTAVSQ